MKLNNKNNMSGVLLSVLMGGVTPALCAGEPASLVAKTVPGKGALSIVSQPDSEVKEKLSLPWGKIALGVGVPLALAAGWWMYREWTRPVSLGSLGNLPERKPKANIINVPSQRKATLEPVFLSRGMKDLRSQVPKAIGDERWKELLQVGSEKLTAQLETLIDAYLQQPLDERRPLKFLHKVLLILAPHMKKLETSVIPLNYPSRLCGDDSNRMLVLVRHCLCCAGRYHVPREQSQDDAFYSQALLLKRRNGGTRGAATGIAQFKIYVPRHETLLLQLDSQPKCRVAIISLAHEMVHIASLDPLRDPLKGHDLLASSERHKRELFADVAVNVFSGKDFCNIQKTGGLIAFMGNFIFEVFAAFDEYKPVRDEGLEEGSWEKEMFLNITKGLETHPSHLTRIKQLLTIWGAHLLWNRKLDKQRVITEVVEGARKVFWLYGEETETIDGGQPDLHHPSYMLDLVLKEWEKEQRGNYV